MCMYVNIYIYTKVRWSKLSDSSSIQKVSGSYFVESLIIFILVKYNSFINNGECTID